MGACVIPFVFHVLSETSAQEAEEASFQWPSSHIASSERNFSAHVVNYWTTFASTRVPSGGVSWPAFDMHDQHAMVIGAGRGGFESTSALRSARCDIWDAL